MANLVLFEASLVSGVVQGLLAQYEWVMKELCVRSGLGLNSLSVTGGRGTCDVRVLTGESQTE